VFLAALTIVFDGIDNQLLGIVIPTVMREWSVPRGAFAPVVSRRRTMSHSGSPPGSRC